MSMKATNYSVRRLLEDVLAGRLLLPDFQRSFVWKPDDVRDLLVSVIGKYYIGSMLYMDETAESSPFATRLIEGVDKIDPLAKKDKIFKILLDGQQRTSSLFYAMHAPATTLAGRKRPTRFFLNIECLLSENWDQIVSVCNAGNKKDLARHEADERFVAFTEFHDIGKLMKKLQHTKFESEAHTVITCINDFVSYELQAIELPRGTSLERVVETFERINKKGIPLSVTDLLVAKLYQEGIKLRELILSAENKYRVFDEIPSEYALRVICLVRDREVRQRDILDLSGKEFYLDWEDACEALQKSYTRMCDTKNGYGVFDFERFAPFQTCIVPLAAMMIILKRSGLSAGKNFAKIDQWYWTTVFSNRYNEAVNTKSYSDFKSMKEWFLDDHKVPEFVKRFNPSSIDLTVENRTHAIYRGVLCLVVLAGALDYNSGLPPQFAPKFVEDDHIFPKIKFEENSIRNRTLVSSNRAKSSQSPSKYFSAIITVNGGQKTQDILDSHLISSSALAALLCDDLHQFLSERDKVLRDRFAILVPSREVPAGDDDQDSNDLDT